MFKVYSQTTLKAEGCTTRRRKSRNASMGALPAAWPAVLLVVGCSLGASLWPAEASQPELSSAVSSSSQYYSSASHYYLETSGSEVPRVAEVARVAPLEAKEQLEAAPSTAQASRQEAASSAASSAARLPAGESWSLGSGGLSLAGGEEDLRLRPEFAYDYHSNMPVITKRELASAVKQAAALVDRRLGSRPSGGSEAAADKEEGAEAEEEPMEPGSAGWLASQMMHRPAPHEDPLVRRQTRQSLVSEQATKLLAKQHKLSRAQILRGLPLISVENTPLGRDCPRALRQWSCAPGLYRSLSGHCNNVQNPHWGAAMGPFARLAAPNYADHVGTPQPSARRPLRPPTSNSSSSPAEAEVAAAGELLPSARQVSLLLGELGREAQAQAQKEHAHMTTMLSFFGQFVFHDVAFVAQLGRPMRCCHAAHRHPECMPVELEAESSQQSAQQSAQSTQTGNYCLDYIRSATAARDGCNLGPRDQLNLVSGYLDGSAIYGSSESQMRALRAFAGGRLRSQRLLPTGSGAGSGAGAQVAGQQQAAAPQQQAAALELLPQLRPNETDEPHWLAALEGCSQMAQMRAKQQSVERPNAGRQSLAQGGCFQAGDLRVNENVGLALMHTIWMREHNRLADQLARLNGHWNDERLFQEARRIVVAQLQHIAYTEFLPPILGPQLVERFNLSSLPEGYSDQYDPQLNAATANELASAVFPFILSTIPDSLERYNERLEIMGSTQLSATFMEPGELLKRNRFGQYLTGMMSQSAMEPALALMPMGVAQMPAEVRADAAGAGQRANSSRVGAPAPDAHQVDAAALIIQQGRDHGVRPYLYWRRACQPGGPPLRSWAELRPVLGAAAVDRLRRAYWSPEQLDLYLGLLERPAAGASLGPTFACLLARQFHRLKFGDRFWFENDLPGLAFTTDQLHQIRQSSLAKVLCRNAQPSLTFVQPSPMLASDPFLNAYQYCSNRALEELDLGPWRQTVSSAQQLADEQLLGRLMARPGAQPERLARGKRLVQRHAQLIGRQLELASGQLDLLARQQAASVRRAAAAKARARRHSEAKLASHPEGKQEAKLAGHAHPVAHYRHLGRPRRQALVLANQSAVLELATGEVLRAILRMGRDPDQTQSLQAELQDFLYTLESDQLASLMDNLASREALERLVGSANSNFLDERQRASLASSGDSTLVRAADSLNELLDTPTARLGSGAVGDTPPLVASCHDEGRVFPCDHTSPFRTITGWCNNLQRPKFGQSFTMHDRLLASAYEDGFGAPRSLSVVGRAAQASGRSSDAATPPRLPSARLVSTRMHEDRTRAHARYSLALMQFGQFGVDHDLTVTPQSVALDGSLLDCSACDSQRTLHPDCLPIEVPPDDPQFGPAATPTLGAGPRCLAFVRSLNGQTGLGPRQQINALTAYIDASEIYGSDNCEAKSLRAFQGGRLNASSHPAGGAWREMLPLTRANRECATPNGFCFHAGDQRASEQPGLSAFHTIFMRFHNSLVTQLASINKHWNDERLYQEGRRIVGALMQRIVYTEFAPRLLGLDYMSRFDLMLKQAGYSDHYDHSCSASILNEFASAAFRMGHSLIRGTFPLLNKHYKPLGKGLQLRTAFFNSQRMLTEPNLLDSILRGIVSTPIETLDNSITDELTNHLFERPQRAHSGMDLVALNIQRARDHGIGPYNSYRQLCNLTRARTFDELAPEVPPELIKRLAKLYQSVDDVDLFTGGLSETPVHGGIVGPTFGCIIGTQLARLKRCDRFWHETSDPYLRFSLPQLAEIRKLSLAKVICSQSDHIDSIQRNAMDLPEPFLNPRVPCSSLPSLDLSLWREHDKFCLLGAKQGLSQRLKLELGRSKRVSPCKSCTCTLEGPACRTAKIDCLKLVRRLAGQSVGQVLADRACAVQCAWALDAQLLRRQQQSAANG